MPSILPLILILLIPCKIFRIRRFNYMGFVWDEICLTLEVGFFFACQGMTIFYQLYS